MGKGSKIRSSEDREQYRDNYSKINWNDSKGKKEDKSKSKKK